MDRHTLRTTRKNLDILAIEPYLTGSHQSFLEALKEHSRHSIEILGLPGRKWKWRMRGSAINFSQDLEQFERIPDLFFVSDFLDVAAFRTLMPARFRDIPLITYFHENQLTYPLNDEAERDYQFAFTNLTTCLASDRVLFNSNYHRESFLTAIPPFLKLMPDHVPEGLVERIRSKSGVQHLGISPEPKTDSISSAKKFGSAQTIVWNHRWEYDKNPELFFRTLFRIDEQKVDFNLVVLGEHFRQSPTIFKEAKQRLKHRILHFGYANSRVEYWEKLSHADIIISTSTHEFFGLSVLEGIAANCFPLLPFRLAYPELLPSSLHEVCFYQSDEELESQLVDLLIHPKPRIEAQLKAFVDEFNWSKRVRDFDKEFEMIKE